MLRLLPMAPACVGKTRWKKTGSISRPFFGAMLAGTVVLAVGYTQLSRRGSSQSGPQSGAFSPPPAPPEAVAQAAPAKATAAKAPAVKAAPAKAPAAKAAPAKTVAARRANPVRIARATPARVEKAPVKIVAQPAPGKAPVVAAPAAAPPVARPRLAQAPAAPSQSGGAAAGEWPEYRGKLRDGISRETGWFGGGEPQVVWQANVGTGFASIAISKGRAYTMGNSGNQDTVWCFDAANGKVLWRYSYQCPIMANAHEGGPGATPTVDGNLVFTYSKAGHLHALDTSNGSVVWRKNIPNDFGGRIPQWGINSSPVVHGNLLCVVAGAPGATVIAFDKNTGEVVWKAGNDGPGYAAPLVFRWRNVPYLAVFNASGIVFHNLQDGKELWRYGWKTAYDVNAATPIIMEDKVFISSGYNTGAALLQSSKDDSLVWRNRNMRNHFNSSVLWNGYLYGFDEDQLACLDWNTGRTMWTQGRLGKGSLIASDGKLIILSERGEMVIAEASPNRFQELSRGHILPKKCWTAPALANGRIYARDAEGNLVCVKF